MSAVMKIDQSGLSAGTAGQSREDGLATGAQVTLTSMSHISTFRFELLWVGQHPSPDAGSVATLNAATSSAAAPATRTFTPTSGVYGSWRIRLVTDEGTDDEDEQILIFGIKPYTNSILVPALNVRSDSRATLTNGSSYIASSEHNVPESSGPFSGGRYGAWWREIADAIYKMDVSPISIRGVTGKEISVQTTEVNLGGFYFDPSLLKSPSITFEFIGDFSAASGSFKLRLYDAGPGGAFAPVLRSTLEIPFSEVGTKRRKTVTLTTNSVPGTNVDQIHNSGRIYEVVAYLDSVDVASSGNVSSAGLLVR